MNTIALDMDRVYQGNLILVNAEHPIKISEENDLIAADPKYPQILLKRETVNILQMLCEKIGSAGRIVPVSGYRTLSEQEDIYNTSLIENGEEFTKKFVALPNCSEHQTGFAIDLGLNQDVIDFICPDFPYDGICGKFRELAAEYGFIERYQRGKENITGIAPEPWHFRYVGYPHSKIISQNGFALEEYCEFVKRFSNQGERLKFVGKGSIVEIFYVKANDSGKTEIDLPQNAVWQISGNNKDGFIVTLWRKDV